MAKIQNVSVDNLRFLDEKNNACEEGKTLENLKDESILYMVYKEGIKKFKKKKN